MRAVHSSGAPTYTRWPFAVLDYAMDDLGHALTCGRERCHRRSGRGAGGSLGRDVTGDAERLGGGSLLARALVLTEDRLAYPLRCGMCAALAAVHHACQLAPYDGQKFAESAPEPQSKSTPVSPERRPARTPSPRPPAKRNP